MSLAWNEVHRNRLASGSADCTIKLWDVTTEQCKATYDYHSSKVQSLEWNPAEPSILLSGSFDKVVAVTDIRSPKEGKQCMVDADVECCRWNPHNPATFFVSTESGSVTYHDARKITEKPIFYLSAHHEACTGLSINTIAPIFATSSVDKSVKIWNYANGTPSLLCGKENMQVGALFSVSFDTSKGNPFLLVAGGNEGKIALWDIRNDSMVKNAYESYQSSLAVTQTTSSTDQQKPKIDKKKKK